MPHAKELSDKTSMNDRTEEPYDFKNLRNSAEQTDQPGILFRVPVPVDGCIFRDNLPERVCQVDADPGNRGTCTRHEDLRVHHCTWRQGSTRNHRGSQGKMGICWKGL